MEKMHLELLEQKLCLFSPSLSVSFCIAKGNTDDTAQQQHIPAAIYIYVCMCFSLCFGFRSCPGVSVSCIWNICLMLAASPAPGSEETNISVFDAEERFRFTLFVFFFH